MEIDEPYMQIPITTKKKGLIANVKCSVQDFTALMKHKWRVRDNYFAATIDSKTISMHTYVKTVLEGLTVPKGYVVNHMAPDNDKLDCRRSKLEIVPHAYNVQNRKKRELEDGEEKYTGVKEITSSRYESSIVVNKKYEYLGTYSSAIEAAEARDIFIVNYPGTIGHQLNFPDRRAEFVGKPIFKKQKKAKTRPYIGVTKISSKMYSTDVRVKGKTIRIGKNTDPKVCAEIYDKYIMENGLDRKTNFHPEYKPPKKVKTDMIAINDTTCKLLIFGGDVFIDLEDYDRIKYYKWYTVNDGKSLHVQAHADGTVILLHRFVVGETDSNVLVDHKDSNPFNNKKDNLRRTNHQGNGDNQSKRADASSQYHNVYLYKTSKANKPRFMVSVVYKGEVVYKEKGFLTEYAAAVARDEYVKTHLSHTLKKLNFPDKK